MELVTERLILREFSLEEVDVRLEGRQRDKERSKGRWWDRLLYAILEDERRARYA
jgi:RimJ/RimL family protein N-acetyltransferase